jgi:hypothetical protein
LAAIDGGGPGGGPGGLGAGGGASLAAAGGVGGDGGVTGLALNVAGGCGVGVNDLAAGTLLPGTLFPSVRLLPGGGVVSFAAAGGAPTLGAPVPGGGEVSAEGVVVNFAAGVPAFGVPAVPVAAAPVGEVGATSFAAGVPPGVKLGLADPTGAVVPGANVGDDCGSGCPFAPGNSAPDGVKPRWPAGPPGLVPCSAALCATDGGSDGPSPTPPTGAAPPRADVACTCGVMVLVWPAGLVTVTVRVALLMTTLLCKLAKMMLFAGGAAT